MRRAEYLQCRRGRWYVRLRVPAHLVAAVGQHHLVRALDTDSEAVACERRWIALSLLWDWIGTQTVSDGWRPAWAANLTVAERSPNGGGHDRPVPSLHGDANHPTTKAPKPRSASCRGTDSLTIQSMMTRWLKEIEGVHTKQSVMQHVLAINEFAQSQTANCTVDRINRRTAGEFVSSVLMQAGGDVRVAVDRSRSIFTREYIGIWGDDPRRARARAREPGP